jgi:hypothetical protein
MLIQRKHIFIIVMAIKYYYIIFFYYSFFLLFFNYIASCIEVSVNIRTDNVLLIDRRVAFL